MKLLNLFTALFATEIRNRFAIIFLNAQIFLILNFLKFDDMTKPDLENFGGGDDKIYKYKLCIISKFCMFMINVLDLAQTCWGYF